MEYVYGNTPGFLHSKKVNDAEEVDAVIYGVPWEGGVTWGDYTSCELGPKSMRLASGRYSGFLPELDFIDVFDHLSLGDIGDVTINWNDSEETMGRITDFTRNHLWNKDVFPIGLGGDHSITYPIIKGLVEEQGKKVGIIHLDAHYDNMPAHGNEKYARNTPFARLYELEGVRNESLIHSGIHGPRNKPEAGRYAKDAGAVTITTRDIREAGSIYEMADEIYRQASTDVDVVYLTICSDVLDFAFNPGGPPDANGLTSYELLTLIHEFGKKGLAGMDFVEVYPETDVNRFSAHTASNIILYVLAGEAKRRQEQRK
ncbi:MULTISPECIES: agmatinase family protein [Salibacterium]|uniref:Agmatinase n=2 Tax=Salibacterium TaxID=1884429 RepID=A0A1I4L3K5_9BACI|nr:agmatinase family protein [Salibacterium qingdaonense]SFL85628.1 agmatinase [Salibacterium qingdaonense]